MSPRLATDVAGEPERYAGVTVRRFERTASGSGLDQFLQSCGYWVRTHGACYRIGRLGSRRAKQISHAELMDLLDGERLKRGLEPIMRRG